MLNDQKHTMYLSYELFWLDSRYSAPKGGISECALHEFANCKNIRPPRLGSIDIVHSESRRNIVGSVAQSVFFPVVSKSGGND